jgi:hypothetical protein
MWSVLRPAGRWAVRREVDGKRPTRRSATLGLRADRPPSQKDRALHASARYHRTWRKLPIIGVNARDPGARFRATIRSAARVFCPVDVVATYQDLSREMTRKARRISRLASSTSRHWLHRDLSTTIFITARASSSWLCRAMEDRTHPQKTLEAPRVSGLLRPSGRSGTDSPGEVSRRGFGTPDFLAKSR